MTGDASATPPAGVGGDPGLRLDGVDLVGPDDRGVTARGLSLSVDRSGIAVGPPGSPPQVIGWDSVDGWRVDPGAGGAILTLGSHGRLARFFAPGWDPGDLGRLVEAARGGPVAGPEGTGGGSVGPAAPIGARRRRAEGFARWQPLLVVVLVLVLAVSVALVLAQSAGAIHLGFLGGTGAATGLLT